MQYKFSNLICQPVKVRFYCTFRTNKAEAHQLWASAFYITAITNACPILSHTASIVLKYFFS